MPTLHDSRDSGNCYKVRLMLSLLGRSFERVEVDTEAGGTRTAAFLALNPNGRVPVLVLDDGRALAESNAILVWLAEGSAWWPDDPFERALALQWMFFEQYSHEPAIAVLRHWRRHPASAPADAAAREPALAARGEAALGVMEGHLATREWFVGARPSVVDLALFAYTHVAEDGPFSLAPYPAVRAWLGRVAGLPGFVAM